MTSYSTADTAVVVGLCPHGLAITRSLKRSGVHVIALEANMRLAGATTNSAEIIWVDDINGPGLIQALIDLSNERFRTESQPVLFLTNDNMVDTIGSSVGELIGRYILSWSHSAREVVPMLRKEKIEQYCNAQGIKHPKSIVIESQAQFEQTISDLQLPLVIKPTRPVSAFKTVILDNPEDTTRLWPIIQTSLPAIVQEFIEGDETNIFFACLFLTNGRVTARFEGRKIRSRPMGHTSIAIGEPNNTLHRYAVDFFKPLNISGPVSLELKRDPAGVFWVIEPTVGRTDFWVGLCIADGVDLPLIELKSSIGTDQLAFATQKKGALWINGERDPFALIWLLIKQPRLLAGSRVVGVLLDRKDIKPAIRWISFRVVALPRRIVAKLAKTIFRSPTRR